MSGYSFPAWSICLWGLALGVIGIAIARALRQRLIVVEALPFPTGAATGEIIDAMHSARTTALTRARVLLLAGLTAAAVTWFRDAKPVLVPQSFMLPFGNAALTAGSLWLGVSLSPVMISTGLLIGPRGATGILLGAIAAWGVLAPLILALKWVANADYASIIGWLLWPGVALLVSSALTSFLMDWRSLGRSLSDLWMWRKQRGAQHRAEPNQSRRTWAVMSSIAAVVALVIAWRVFGVHPLFAALALAFSFVLASVCARAAGETDIAPAGAIGALGQILFGASSFVTSLFCGGLASGTATQTAQTLWAFKAGQRLEANPHNQALGQLLGVFVGGVVVVPIYALMLRAYGLGTASMPAPGAISWKATAEAMRLGAAAMPSHAVSAALIAFALGVILTLLARTPMARYLPAPVPLGIAFVIPASLAGAVFVGGMILVVLRLWRPAWVERHLTSLAAGAIAGESLTGISIAALIAGGVFG